MTETLADALPKEIDRVTLLRPIQHGATAVPAGAKGTVTTVYAGGKTCEVEFDEPHAVLTVGVADVAAVAPDVAALAQQAECILAMRAEGERRAAAFRERRRARGAEAIGAAFSRLCTRPERLDLVQAWCRH